MQTPADGPGGRPPGAPRAAGEGQGRPRAPGASGGIHGPAGARAASGTAGVAVAGRGAGRAGPAPLRSRGPWHLWAAHLCQLPSLLSGAIPPSSHHSEGTRAPWARALTDGEPSLGCGPPARLQHVAPGGEGMCAGTLRRHIGASDPGVPRASPKEVGEGHWQGAQAPQSQICRQDVPCTLQALNMAWLRGSSGRGTAWCSVVDTWVAQLGPWGSCCSPWPSPHPERPTAPHRAPTLERGPSRPAPPAVRLRKGHFSDEEAEDEAPGWSVAA